MDQQKVLKSIQESLTVIARRESFRQYFFKIEPWINSNLCLEKPIVQRHGSMTNPLAETVESRHESRNSSAPPDSVDSPKTPGSSNNLSFDNSGNNFAHFRSSNGDALTFPDNLIGETELLIVAIKKFLSEIKETGVNTNAIYHADSVIFTYLNL